MKGIGTDETALLSNLASLNPDQVVSVRAAYRKVDRYKERDLMKDVHSETSGYFRDGLEGQFLAFSPPTRHHDDYDHSLRRIRIIC